LPTLSAARSLPGDGKTELSNDVIAAADSEQIQALKMVASQMTIDFIKRAAETDEQYQLLRRQIAAGWPNSSSDVPHGLREFTTFADELIECDGLVLEADRISVSVTAPKLFKYSVSAWFRFRPKLMSSYGVCSSPLCHLCVHPRSSAFWTLGHL
jgi:hypothetical protein